MSELFIPSDGAVRFECMDCEEEFPLSMAETTDDGVKLCHQCHAYLCEQLERFPE